MRSPRGVILLAIMLVLGVLTLAAVPLIGARGAWGDTSPLPTILAPRSAQLGACQRLAVARLKSGVLEEGPLGACVARRLPRPGAAQVWHLAAPQREGRALELWAFGEGDALQVHVRPTPR